jgi:acetolactate synthase-1/2/3 large subunit
VSVKRTAALADGYSLPSSGAQPGTTQTAGQQIARVLKQEGVEIVFTLCGGHLVPIHEACFEEGIRIIDTRHEQAAVHAAEGYAIATGKPGVAILTAGPGVTNGVTGVAQAYMSGSPVLVIGGRSPMAQFDKVPLQDIDQVSLMRPITKWARTVHSAERAGEYTATAFREMLDGLPGPVFLDVPLDLVGAPVPMEQVTAFDGYRAHSRPAGDPAMIERAVEMLARAERPVVVASTRLHWAAAAEELQRFADVSQIPVFTVNFARGAIPDDHPLSFGPSPYAALEDADVLLALGVTFDFFLGFGKSFGFGKVSDTLKVIQVDAAGGRIGLNRPVELGIVGDIKHVLRQLSERFPRPQTALPWVQEVRGRNRAWRNRMDVLAHSDTPRMHPFRLTKEVGEFIDRDATVIADGGDIGIYSYFYLRSYFPGRTYWSMGPAGNLGAGISCAIAAKALRPNSQVLTIVGDGSFGINAMEIDTALRHDLPIVCVIGNDGGWGNIRWPWRRRRADGFSVAVELGFQRYDLMVRGMGGHGEFVERPEDIKPALERAFASGKAACVNVVVDSHPAASPYEFFPRG